MSFRDFIEVLKMVKEAERDMRTGRFWALLGACYGAVAVGGVFAAAKLLEVLK